MTSRFAIAVILAGSSAAAAGADDVAVTLRGAYETEYVFRGSTLAQDVVRGSVEIIVPQENTEFYAGLGGLGSVDDPGGAFDFPDEYTAYFGGALHLFDRIWLDAGYTQYLYADDDFGLFHSGEDRGQLHLGAFINVEVLDREFDPSAFIYYDFEREEFVIEVDANYTQLVGPNLYIDLSGYVGASLSAEGSENTVVAGALTQVDIEEYAYYGLGADVRFDVSGRADIYAGARWHGASEDRFYDDFDPATGLPSSLESDTALFHTGLRVRF